MSVNVWPAFWRMFKVLRSKHSGKEWIYTQCIPTGEVGVWGMSGVAGDSPGLDIGTSPIPLSGLTFLLRVTRGMERAVR